MERLSGGAAIAVVVGRLTTDVGRHHILTIVVDVTGAVVEAAVLCRVRIRLLLLVRNRWRQLLLWNLSWSSTLEFGRILLRSVARARYEATQVRLLAIEDAGGLCAERGSVLKW